MVYIKNSTWQIAIRLQKVTGSWPYQGEVKNYLLMLASFLILSGSVFGLMISVIKNWNVNLAIAIESFDELMPPVILIAKILTLVFVEKKCTQQLASVILTLMFIMYIVSLITPNRKIIGITELSLRSRILEQVARHFETVIEEDEVKILRKFTDKGLMLTITSTLCIISGVGIFLAMPYVRMFLYYFFGDGELHKFLPIPIDYLVDEKKYFYWIALEILFTFVVSLMVQLSFDLTFFMTVRHVCALFEIVKLRLARASKIFEQCAQNKRVSDSDEEKAYEILTSAVDLHNEALELTQLIDDTYNVCMFIVLLLNAIVLAPLPASVMQRIDDPFELIRHSMGFLVFPVHFYVTFLQGQLVIDYSSSVFDACYEFQWYNTSKRCRDTIIIMMSRTFTPSRLTGGNLFYLSMETYSVMLKTAISYISMFAAFLE